MSYYEEWKRDTKDPTKGQWEETRKIAGIRLDESKGMIAEFNFTRPNTKKYSVHNEILEGNEVIGLRCSNAEFLGGGKSLTNLSFVLWSGPIRYKDNSE